MSKIRNSAGKADNARSPVVFSCTYSSLFLLDPAPSYTLPGQMNGHPPAQHPASPAGFSGHSLAR